MADPALDDFTADDLNAAADDLILQVKRLDRWRQTAAVVQSIASAKNAEANAKDRLDAIRAKEDAAKADLADALAAVDQAKTDAKAQASSILQQARADADALTTKARSDVRTELASTNAELEQARRDLAATQDRLTRARDALSG